LSKYGAEAVNKWDLIHENDQAEYRETILNRPGRPGSRRVSAGMWNFSIDCNVEVYIYIHKAHEWYAMVCHLLTASFSIVLGDTV